MSSIALSERRADSASQRNGRSQPAIPVVLVSDVALLSCAGG
jgi:hypothetical protein